MSWMRKEENWPNWGSFHCSKHSEGFQTRKYEKYKQGLEKEGKGFWKYGF